MANSRIRVKFKKKRVFSILNDCFDDDQLNALDDYVQLSLMLQYNARGRSRGA